MIPQRSSRLTRVPENGGVAQEEPNASVPALALVIPSFQEVRNIRPLLRRVRAALDPWNLAYEVIVVDDASGDGMEEAVAEIAQCDPRVRIIVRTGERGLAGAVLRGWAESEAPLLAVMDSDLQHPPELLPEMWTALETGVDLVIGSRYASGASLRGWQPLRQLISKVAVWMTFPVQRSGLRALDPMSGYFMVRRCCIDGIELQKTGFKILLEILARAEIRSVAEVPFTFGSRHAGCSKANFQVALAYVALLFRLYRRRGRQPSRVRTRTPPWTRPDAPASQPLAGD